VSSADDSIGGDLIIRRRDERGPLGEVVVDEHPTRIPHARRQVRRVEVVRLGDRAVAVDATVNPPPQ
jgi:hypothetical protein